MIVNPRRRNITVAEPFLNLIDVRIVIDLSGCRSGTQRMGADLETALEQFPRRKVA